MVTGNDNNYEDDIDSAIKKKLKGWDRTRHNRIEASERLKGYSQKWSIVTFIFNVEAVICVILTLKFPLKNQIDVVVSGIFSIYVILLQYFLATLNYEARSLKFHYEQIGIENLRMELKQILYKNNDNNDKSKKEQYYSIVKRYEENLIGYENHSRIDDKRSSNKDLYIRDFSIENMLIYINFIIALIIVIIFICIYFVSNHLN